jgi:hypothetical protein
VNRRDPMLPRPVLVFLAVVVALGWLTTVVAAFRDSANSGPLLVVTGLLATVIGAGFGIQVGRARSNGDRDNGPGDDAS